MITEQIAEPDVVRACRALHAAIDKLDQAAADRAGVSRTDLRCLNLLEHGPATPTRIARELGLTTGGVTALLDRLERVKLIERSRNPGDRRGVLVRPTAHLFALLGPLYRAVAEHLARSVACYGSAEQAQAVKHLADVTGACVAALDAVRQA